MAAVTIDSSVSSSGAVLFPNPDLPINNPIIVDPENVGEPLPPTEFTSLNAGEIGAPVVFSSDSEAVIIAPVIVGAESGAAIATPTAKTAQSIPATALPTAETAQNPAVIATPTIKTPETPATVAIPTANTAQSIPATATPTIETAEAAATISTPTINTARTIPATDVPTANTAEAIPATAIPSLFTAVSVGAVAPPFPLNYARILYQNLLIGSSVSVTTGTGGSLTLIPNTYESWRFTNGAEITFTLPANADVDTFCVGAHNLGAEGFSVGVDFSSATTGAFSPFTTGQLPTDNKALMFHRSSTVDVRRIKLVCSGTGSISIGSIYAGVALQLMRPFYAGFTPPRWAEKTTYRNTNSSTGNFLGRDIVRVGGETSIDVNNLDNDWIETYFMPFKNAVKLSPYYIAWNLSEHPLDVALCQTSDDVELSPNGIRDLVQASWSAMIYGSL
jgi:hypothetical protein